MPLRTDFSAMNCSLARALGELGDPWTLLVLRECVLGVERFDDFAAALGVCRRTLAQRLAAMVERGLLERHARSPAGKVASYRLTAKAQAAIPALVALMHWGDEWLSGKGHEPIKVTSATGAAIAPLHLRTASGRAVEPGALRFAAGPGADRRTRGHLDALAARGARQARTSPAR